MISSEKMSSNIGIAVSIAILVSTSLIPMDRDVASAIRGLGAIFFLFACASYARAKGYSGGLGLIALLPIIGLIILVLLPDKNK